MSHVAHMDEPCHAYGNIGITTAEISASPQYLSGVRVVRHFLVGGSALGGGVVRNKSERAERCTNRMGFVRRIGWSS